MSAQRPIVIGSNRGPVSLVAELDGSIRERRGVGGLVTAVGSAITERDALWIAAPMTPADRAAGDLIVEERPDTKLRVRFIDVAPAVHDLFYNEFSNRILWFLHHYLWAPAPAPVFTEHDARAWEAYRDVNARFAEAMTAGVPADAVALPQDYHLSLVPRALRDARPNLPIAQFWHIPFCRPDQFDVAGEWGPPLLEGMLGADLLGFHAEWWASNFTECCAAVLGARITEGPDGWEISHARGRTRVGVFPIGADVEGLRSAAGGAAVARAMEDIERIVGDRILVLRVDRTELSKNILRGLDAYGGLLERRHDLHGRVVHLVLLTSSRGDVPEYQEYTRACVTAAERINARFGNEGWSPVVLEIDDDYSRSLAAYRRYDVLLVNPVFDGMNLVAREGPVLNEREGVLVLSANAGAAAELGTAALIVNPFDARDTARALESALDMLPAERAHRAAQLKMLAPGTPPDQWLDRQITRALDARGL